MSEEESEEKEIKVEAFSTEIFINLSEVVGFGEGNMNHFPINKKRVFVKISAAILEDVKMIMEKEGYEWVLELAHFRQKSLVGEIVDEDQLIEELKILLDGYFDYAYNYCNDNYNVEIVAAAQNKELQFDRSHIIILLACSMVYRISIPLITSYVVDTHYEGKAEGIFLRYFIYVLEEMQKRIGRPVNMQNKLRRLVESRVCGTEYSDSVVWNYLKNVGVNPVEFIQPLYRKLITDITPKLTIDENVINFFHVVIKKQLQYLFRSNIPLTYETVNSAIEPDEASIFDTDITKFSQNEIYSVLATEGISDMKLRINRAYGNDVEVTDDEVSSYFGKIIPNKDKEILFFTFFGKYSEDYEILYTINKTEFTYLCLLLYKILSKYNFDNLANLMITNWHSEDSLNSARAKLTKKFLEQIRNSSKYKDLQEKYFSNINQRYEKNNTIILLIEQSSKMRHWTIPMNDEEPEEVFLNEEALASEILRFVGFIV
jgi:hypothetical protein